MQGERYGVRVVRDGAEEKLLVKPKNFQMKEEGPATSGQLKIASRGGGKMRVLVDELAAPAAAPAVVPEPAARLLSEPAAARRRSEPASPRRASEPAAASGSPPTSSASAVTKETKAKSLSEPAAGPRLRQDVSVIDQLMTCLLYTSPSPRDGLLSRMPSSA